MSIWITGAGGLLSQAIKQTADQRGLSTVLSSRKDCDIADPLAIEHWANTHGPFSCLINCAAYTCVDDAESEQAQALRCNRDGPKALALWAAKHNCRFLHFSTDYVFDGKKQSPYCETDATQPVNAYGKSKLLGEKLIWQCYPSACIVRTSSLFGQGGKHFVQTILNLLQTKKTLQVVTDQMSCPTYANDLAHHALDLLEASGLYHVSNTGAVSWHNFAEAIWTQAKNAGITLSVERIVPVLSCHFPRPAIRPSYSVLSNEKFIAATGTTPRHWQESLQEYFTNLNS